MAKTIRGIRLHDMEAYIELLRLGFSEGPGRVDTVNALLRAATLYRRFFFLWKGLSFLHLFPTIVPTILVCEKNGRVIGVMGICRRGNREGPYCLLHTVVDPESRRQGIASRLLSYFEGNLDPGKPHILLTRVREDNLHQIGNRKKSGFHAYARELTFSFKPDSWSGTVPRPNKSWGQGSSLSSETVSITIPRPAEISQLKYREMPREIASCDPTAIFSFGMPPGFSTFLTSIFLTPCEWKAGIRINGEFVACGTLVYHRLQHTYELELSALPEAENAVHMLIGQVMLHVSKTRKAPINVIVCDYQHSVVEALRHWNFSVNVRKLRYVKSIPNHNQKQ